jgi:hypothetical protein
MSMGDKVMIAADFIFNCHSPVQEAGCPRQNLCYSFRKKKDEEEESPTLATERQPRRTAHWSRPRPLGYDIGIARNGYLYRQASTYSE